MPARGRMGPKDGGGAQNRRAAPVEGGVAEALFDIFSEKFSPMAIARTAAAMEDLEAGLRD